MDRDGQRRWSKNRKEASETAQGRREQPPPSLATFLSDGGPNRVQSPPAAKARINDVILVYIYLHPRFIGTVLSWILTAATQAVSEYFPRFRIQRTKAAILANAMTIPVNLNIFEFVSNS
jgi:hypothetical protein